MARDGEVDADIKYRRHWCKEAKVRALVEIYVASNTISPSVTPAASGPVSSTRRMPILAALGASRDNGSSDSTGNSDRLPASSPLAYAIEPENKTAAKPCVRVNTDERADDGDVEWLALFMSEYAGAAPRQ